MSEIRRDTEAPSTVTEALSRVMAELPGIGKDQRADPKQGGYAYRGIEAITRQVQPLLARYGVVIVPHVHSHDVIDIVVNDKAWTDTRLLVSYTVYGPGGTEDRIEVGPILAIGRDNSDKGANKCMTQAFKYLLLQLLCVSDAKDDADGASVEAERHFHARPSDRPADREWLTRFRAAVASAARDAGLDADQERHRIVAEATGGRTASSGELWSSEQSPVNAAFRRWRERLVRDGAPGSETVAEEVTVE
jgi:hypothetical protein